MTFDWKSHYELGEGFTGGAFRAVVVGDDAVNGIALTSGDWAPRTKLRFRQYEGKKLYDCIGTQHATVKFFSDRVITALRTSNATGWDTYSIRLEGADGSEITGYHGLIVKGRCGPIDNTRSVPVDKILVGNGNVERHATVWKGMYFDEDSWDGSDIFRPTGTGYTYMTERVRNALVAVKATNMVLTSLLDIDRPVLY